jgi:type IV pilus assembly protein PilQ
VPQAAPTALRQFSGSPIDVDYQAANLRTVLRQLSEIGGINLVIDPSVPPAATVDLKLTQVPWDQVMDVILKSSQLTYKLDGSVLRVMTQEARTKELDDDVKQRRASEQAPDLQTRRIRLNYSNASAVAKLLEDARLVSDRGSVEFEERTNMLIIKDSPKSIDDIRSSSPSSTGRNHRSTSKRRSADEPRHGQGAWRAVGLNGAWRRDSATPRPRVPRTADARRPRAGAGRVTQGPTDPRATRWSEPARREPARAGRELGAGAVDGRGQRRVRPRRRADPALEHEGKVKILSTPRVTTQNNKQAEITQGFQIPIQTSRTTRCPSRSRTRASSCRDAADHGANTVIMKISLENGIRTSAAP